MTCPPKTVPGETGKLEPSRSCRPRKLRVSCTPETQWGLSGFPGTLARRFAFTEGAFPGRSAARVKDGVHRRTEPLRRAAECLAHDREGEAPLSGSSV
jgi:hypothetical protein